VRHQQPLSSDALASTSDLAGGAQPSSRRVQRLPAAEWYGSRCDLQRRENVSDFRIGRKIAELGAAHSRGVVWLHVCQAQDGIALDLRQKDTRFRLWN